MTQTKRIAQTWGGSTDGYAISEHPANGSWIIAPVEAGRMVSDQTRTIRVPADLTSETALLVPLVTEALRSWDLLQLEIGAAALVTMSGPWAALFELVASWYGGFAVPVKMPDSSASSGGSDFEAVASLAHTLAGYPMVCAVDLSGRADIVDTLLETVPIASRVLFAGPRYDRFTIDYYVNVHRKGLHLTSTILSPSRIFSPGECDARLLDRAARLLRSRARAGACHDAVSQGAHQQ